MLPEITRTTTPSVEVTTMRREHIAGVEQMLAPFGYDSLFFTMENLPRIFERFPEGQLVALLDGQVVSYAVTMRTNRPPTAQPLPWLAMIGDTTLRHHQPAGEWLYGVDFMVDSKVRKMGIGSKMYQARFNLVRRLNLRGFYAGGMLMGYSRYAQSMSVRSYGDKVMRGELEDPTVTMQLRRGFKPRSFIENYAPQPDAGNGAVLIEWQNHHYLPAPVKLIPATVV